MQSSTWTFSVPNKSGHFSFGNLCAISFTSRGFLWFLGNQYTKFFTVQSQRLDARWEEENCRSSRQKPIATSIGIIDSLHRKAPKPPALHSTSLALLHWFPKNQRKPWVVKEITQKLPKEKWPDLLKKENVQQTTWLPKICWFFTGANNLLCQ